MKKVAIVINSAWQGYNFRLNLARALKINNYDVNFIAPNDDKYSDKLKKEFSFTNVDFQADGLNPINDLRVCFSLFKVFKKIKPDIVLNFTIKPNIYSTIVAKVLGIHSINNITGLGTVFVRKTVITVIVKLLYKVSMLFSTYVFFQNSDDKRYFVNSNLVSVNKCSIIPGSGVDTKKFIPGDFQNDEIFRFLLVARVKRDKGVYEYINASKIVKEKYNNVEFGLLGEIGAHNRTSISKQEILKFHNAGTINYIGKTDNVREQLLKTSCVVLPSYREGSPRSLMEAMSMKIPVVATDVPGCRQIVDDSINGFLCKVKDSANLAYNMEKVINLSKEERIKMGVMGRRKMVNLYDESIVIDQYLDTLNKILAAS